MTHRSRTAGLAAFILVAVLSVRATPAAAQEAVQQPAQPAQQAPGPAGTAEASATQVGAPSGLLPGPRLSPEFPRVEPAIAERGAAGPVPPAQNTIVISTLALVLIAVIVTILVVN